MGLNHHAGVHDAAGVFMRCLAVGIIVVSFLALYGCGPQPVPQPPPPPPKVAGLWTAADSQSVAKELSESALHQQWLIAFHTHANRQPKVCVKAFEAKATPGGDSATAALPVIVNDDLDADSAALVEQFSAALAASQQLELVQDPAQADFTVSGSFARVLISDGARYPVDLQLRSASGETVWTGGIEHTITTPAETPAPAAVEAPAPK